MNTVSTPPSALRYFKDDLVATVVSFAGIGLVRLISSVILTRLLYPEVYGLVAMLMWAVFVMEMISDIGIVAFVTRAERGDERRYINTVWTVRVIRGFINCGILVLAAPLIASLYDTPALEGALRIFAAWFVISGFESMSFAVAIRRKKARIPNYCELLSTFVSTIFVIAYSRYARDHTGIMYGILLDRLLMTIMSYFFYKELRPRFALQRSALKDLFAFSKFVTPSSMITLALTQYDKVVFLKLFNLRMLGLYGLASNVIAPVDGLIARMCRRVLYPRCAHDFREAPHEVGSRYYRNNVLLFAMTLGLPAAVCGAGSSIIAILYDARYEYAGIILQAFAIRSMLLSIASHSENLLVACGDAKVYLVGNLCRIAWLIPASLVGYTLWGFEGFLFCAVLDVLPATLYLFWLQRARGMLVIRYEVAKIAFALLVLVAAWFVGGHLLEIFNEIRGLH